MKRITKKFQKLGFVLIGESDAGVTYARDHHSYRHFIGIVKTKYGYLIKSYREDMNPDGWFDAIALTPKEWRLTYKAYRRHKRKYAHKNYNA